MAGARDLERAIVDFVGGLPDTNLAVWILDRVGAMPIGPDGKDPSPFGLGDSVASGFEVLIVVACTAALLRRPARSLRP